MTKLTNAEASILGQVLVYLRILKNQNDCAFSSGLVRGLITSLGSFTGFSGTFLRLSDLEDQIKRPVKRRLP